MPKILRTYITKKEANEFLQNIDAFKRERATKQNITDKYKTIIGETFNDITVLEHIYKSNLRVGFYIIEKSNTQFKLFYYKNKYSDINYLVEEI